MKTSTQSYGADLQYIEKSNLWIRKLRLPLDNNRVMDSLMCVPWINNSFVFCFWFSVSSHCIWGSIHAHNSLYLGLKGATVLKVCSPFPGLSLDLSNYLSRIKRYFKSGGNWNEGISFLPTIGRYKPIYVLFHSIIFYLNFKIGNSSILVYTLKSEHKQNKHLKPISIMI